MLGRFAFALALACAPLAARAEAPAMAETARVIAAGEARIAVRTLGAGAPVLFIPSAARGVEDFEALAAQLAAHGRMAILPDPRGIGGSSGPDPHTIADLADDAAAVLDQIAPGARVDVIGHAFGQRVARMLAARHPDKVRSLVLLAAGGRTEMPDHVRRDLGLSVSQGVAPDEQRLAAMQNVFFARGQDARVWLTGWSVSAAQAQAAAVGRTPLQDWWSGGEAPILAIQALEDPIAPPANSAALAEEFGARVIAVQLAHASHAMLPEQPDAVAAVVAAYLDGERDPRVLQQAVDRALRVPAS